MEVQLLVKQEWFLFDFLFTERSIIFKAGSSCRTVWILCHVTMTSRMLYRFLSCSASHNLHLKVF